VFDLGRSSYIVSNLEYVLVIMDVPVRNYDPFILVFETSNLESRCVQYCMQILRFFLSSSSLAQCFALVCFSFFT